MRAAVDAVFGRIAVADLDYVIIARKTVANVSWNELLRSVESAVIFLNRKVINAQVSAVAD